MPRSYEIIYIMPANLPEADQQAIEAKVTDWLTSDGGEIKNSSHWGRRRLAYNIGQIREGYYVFLEAELETDQLKEFNRRMRIDPAIIRHLVVRAET